MNVYPVKVQRPDGTLVRNCRLILEGDTTTVWSWELGADAPTVLIEQPGPPGRVGASMSYVVDGLRVDPQRGCGCGHRMYTWVPESVTG